MKNVIQILFGNVAKFQVCLLLSFGFVKHLDIETCSAFSTLIQLKLPWIMLKPEPERDCYEKESVKV